MAENLFTPLLQKKHVDARLITIESGLRNNKIQYTRQSTKDDIEARIKQLEKAEAHFFDIFNVEGKTTSERAKNLNKRVVDNKIVLTKMNGKVIQNEILDACSASYNEAMLQYLRKYVLTEDTVEEELSLYEEFTDWTEAFVNLLNKEIKAKTGKAGRLKSNTRGLKEARGGSYNKLLAKNLTSRAREVIEMAVREHVEQTTGERRIELYDYVLSDKGVTVESTDWRKTVRGLTVTQAKKMEAEGIIDIDEINDSIIALILDYSGTYGRDRIRLSAVIKTFLLDNPSGRYAFFVGNNNKAITGLLGEIQGLYYICSLFGVDSVAEVKGALGKRLTWLADTYGKTSKKLSIDILLDAVGIQVKNTTRDVKDDFYYNVDFTKSKLTLKTLMNEMGVTDEKLVELVSSLFQTHLFNVEYQYEEGGYIQAENLDFRDSREKMEELISLTESMLALWMETAMHIGINKSARTAIADNVNAIYFVNGVFFGASEILSKLFKAVEDNTKTTGMSITPVLPTGGETIVRYLNRGERGGRKKSMFGTEKNMDVDLKISTSFNFMSLLN